MAKLVLMVDGVGVNQFELQGSKLTIGRSTDNDVHIDDLAVSSRHAEVEVNQDENFGNLTYWVNDLGSTNKTFVNDAEVSRHRLHNNDIIRIGWNEFKFVDENEVDTEKTAYILQDTKTPTDF
ncbi:MAG: FHA domain-containing protein [Granulosicoccaceae bacterium]|jgi:pSer/pThr/pTyr-binding forkhead associated (FHA) protein